jgi:hypothetical protein
MAYLGVCKRLPSRFNGIDEVPLFAFKRQMDFIRANR